MIKLKPKVTAAVTRAKTNAERQRKFKTLRKKLTAKTVEETEAAHG